MITLIIILLIDFGLIVNTNNKWNETVKKIDNLTQLSHIKPAAASQKNPAQTDFYFLSCGTYFFRFFCYAET